MDVFIVKGLNAVTQSGVRQGVKKADPLPHALCCSGKKQNMNDTKTDEWMKRVGFTLSKYTIHIILENSKAPGYKNAWSTHNVYSQRRKCLLCIHLLILGMYQTH